MYLPQSLSHLLTGPIDAQCLMQRGAWVSLGVKGDSSALHSVGRSLPYFYEHGEASMSSMANSTIQLITYGFKLIAQEKRAPGIKTLLSPVAGSELLYVERHE